MSTNDDMFPLGARSEHARSTEGVDDTVIQRVTKDSIHPLLRLIAWGEAESPSTFSFATDGEAHPMSLPYTSPMQNTLRAPQNPGQNAPGICLAAVA